MPAPVFVMCIIPGGDGPKVGDHLSAGGQYAGANPLAGNPRQKLLGAAAAHVQEGFQGCPVDPGLRAVFQTGNYLG